MTHHYTLALIMMHNTFTFYDAVHGVSKKLIAGVSGLNPYENSESVTDDENMS